MRTAILLLVSVFSLASARGQSSATSSPEVQIHFRRASAALNAGAPAKAMKDFLEVLALDPGNAEAYADLGIVVFRQRNHSQALKCLSSAVSIDPSLVKSAYVHDRRALRMDPGSAQANLSLGKVLMMTGQLRQAMTYNNRQGEDDVVRNW